MRLLGPGDLERLERQAVLLPYLEATPVYNAINFAFDPLVCNSQNFQNTAFLTVIPVSSARLTRGQGKRAA